MKANPVSEPEMTSSYLTGNDLFALGNDWPAELIEGKRVYMSPTSYRHGRIELKIGRLLDRFVEQHRLGQVMVGEVGIYTRRHPDTVRGADVAFISNERLSQAQSENYLDVAPELIVEILSPNDRWRDVTDKLDEYFAVGVWGVWIVDPERRQVLAYRSPTEAKRFVAGDMLTGEKVLPGFSVPVDDLFS
jgi:Uma2 family endonuclease